MRVAHLVKHFISESESWLRALLAAANYSPTVLTTRLIEGHRPVPGVDLRQYAQVPEAEEQQAIGRTLAREGYVVHAHFMDTAWPWLPLLRAMYPLTVVSVYGVDLTSLPARTEWRDRYRKILGATGALVVQGPASRRHVVSWGAADDRVVVVPLGVARGQLRDKAQRAGGPVRFLQAAHYREKKGHRVTVEAFAQAFGSCGRATLTLVGDQPLSRDEGAYAWVQRFVEVHRLEKVVAMSPSVRHPRFLQLLDDHDVYVQPSVTTTDGDVEGGPVAVLDAQSRGVPVIATHHENLPLLVNDGHSGILVAEGDPTALAEAMDRLAQSVEVGDTTMSLAARHHAAGFTAEAAELQLEDLYTRLLRWSGPR